MYPDPCDPCAYARLVELCELAGIIRFLLLVCAVVLCWLVGAHFWRHVTIGKNQRSFWILALLFLPSFAVAGENIAFDPSLSQTLDYGWPYWAWDSGLWQSDLLKDDVLYSENKIFKVHTMYRYGNLVSDILVYNQYENYWVSVSGAYSVAWAPSDEWFSLCWIQGYSVGTDNIRAKMEAMSPAGYTWDVTGFMSSAALAYDDIDGDGVIKFD